MLDRMPLLWIYIRWLRKAEDANYIHIVFMLRFQIVNLFVIFLDGFLDGEVAVDIIVILF